MLVWRPAKVLERNRGSLAPWSALVAAWSGPAYADHDGLNDITRFAPACSLV